MKKPNFTIKKWMIFLLILLAISLCVAIKFIGTLAGAIAIEVIGATIFAIIVFVIFKKVVS